MERQIKPVETKVCVDPRAGCETPLSAYDINLRTLLSLYYIGTGAMYIGYLADFLGIPGGSISHRSHHQHVNSIDKVILDLRQKVFDKALVEEVKMTMKEKCSVKYETNMVQ